MVNEIKFCPTCGQGTLDSEKIEESSSDGYIQTFYYSCDHKQVKINVSVTTRVKAELKKIVSRSGNNRHSADVHRCIIHLPICPLFFIMEEISF